MREGPVTEEAYAWLWDRYQALGRECHDALRSARRSALLEAAAAVRATPIRPMEFGETILHNSDCEKAIRSLLDDVPEGERE